MIEHTPPPFFNRGPAPVVRLTFFVLTSILLMVLDARFRYTEPLRQVLAVLVYPLQWAVIAPIEATGHLGKYFESLVDLHDENVNLRAQKLRDAEDLLTLDALRAENKRLREMLEARQRIDTDSAFAEILYAGRDQFARKVVIDKGLKDSIRRGEPVIDATGVLGQVTRVFPLVAEVTLITQKDHPTPVQVLRNGLRAVIYGAGDGMTLDLRFLSANADVQSGDELVTSGLDGIYPPGLPVARVAKVERDAALSFARITCLPLAGVDEYRQVLVLSRTTELPPPPAEETPGAGKAPAKQKPRPRSDGKAKEG